MSGERIFLDTSAWIEYLKNGRSVLANKVDEVLRYATVVVAKVVLAELIHGAKREHEVEAIRDFFQAFAIVDPAQDTWERAGYLCFQLKRRGKQVGLVDGYIAVLCSDHHCQLLTGDKHFVLIREVLPLKLV